MSTINDLKWRHAVKAYDADKKVGREDLMRLLEVIQLAPTSSGLQPFEVFVIESEESKKKLASTCYLNNAEYVMNSTFTLLFAGWDNYTKERIEQTYEHITAMKGLPTGRYSEYTNRLVEKYTKHQSASENFTHIARQAYIAIGMVLTEAASLRLASTPIEGFYQDKLDELYGLPAQHLKSLCVITVGYADEAKDWNGTLKKARRPLDEMVHFI